jgi:HK97 family phage major capsid protein
MSEHVIPPGQKADSQKVVINTTIPAQGGYVSGAVLDALKIGARNNAEDKGRIREVRKAARAIVDHTMAMEPDDEDREEMVTKYLADPASIVVMGDTVKALPDGRVGGYLVRFSTAADPDITGEFFTAETDFGGAKNTPILYHHGGDKIIGKRIIGAGELKADEVGVWVEAQLNMRDRYEKAIYEMAKAGKLGWSSGTAGHLVERVRKSEGAVWLKSWPLGIDASLTPTPAEPRNTSMSLKSVTQPEAAAGVKATGAADTDKHLTGVIDMDEKELLELLDKRDAAKAAADAEAKKAAEIDTLRKENEELKTAAAKANRLPGGAPLVREYADTDKYDGLDAAETALAADVLRGANRPVPVGMVKAIALKTAREEKNGYARGNLKAAGFGDLSDAAIKAATDPMYSTGSLIGSDWVGTAYSNQIWEAIRANAQVVGRIPTVVIPDGYSSEYFPVESTDPTWYKVAETTANDSTMKIPVGTVTVSQMATATKQLTVAKMGARVDYTGELTEDSIIGFAPQLRMQLAKSGAEMMEYVVIDGDTATSSNINDIGGTTYSGAATSLFLLTNGFRKSPLVTTTTQSRSAAGGFVVEDFIATLKLLGSNGIGAGDPRQCAFIVDPNTWFAAMQLPEAKDANQTVLRVQDGAVKYAYGVEVVPSWFMHKNSTSRKANTAGKVDQDTAGNNLYGAILAVRFDQWKLGYKRRMTMEVTRRPESDSWSIVALTRWGLAQRDTLAAAETYYVGV